jgi:rare lipoprotein A
VRSAVCGVIVGLCLSLAGCSLFRRAPPVVAHPHYQLGQGYQAGGTWYYPAESYNAVQTGLAAVDPARPRGLTADGEVYDPKALAAAHQTLQLPAIARLTDLRNGRQIVVRVNDRGPATPARLVSVTPYVARLLELAPADPVRLEVLAEPSHEAVEAIGGGPRLAIATAPREAILAEALPPPGVAVVRPRPVAAVPTVAPQAAPSGPALLPRLAPTVMQGPVGSVTLMLHLGDFSNAGPAAMQARRVADLGAAVTSTRNGRGVSYQVDAGPFRDAAAAEAALDRALRAGVTDARIVVR